MARLGWPGFVLTALVVAGTFLAACTLSGPVPAATPTVTPVEDKATWDLVLLSDSSGWGVADLYAAYLEEDLDVTVAVHDLSAGSLSAGSVLAALRGERSVYPLSVDVPGLVREAEVVVVYGNPVDSISASHPGDWHCTPGQVPYVRDCAPEVFDAYRADLEAIYAEILGLRGGAPVLIRAFDAYNPLYSVYREHAVYDECVSCWEKYNEAIRQAAAAYHVPVARVFDAFNGANHDEDPRDKGYIGADGIHATAQGHQAIADCLRELGYEPVEP
ncbi:MAG TPA: GDSL-type esterase/lipase family protein [Anaerolineae bacterium]|nr:GDSL-type esterase/lipase family protein [Anaerolineae bacterium]